MGFSIFQPSLLLSIVVVILGSFPILTSSLRILVTNNNGQEFGLESLVATLRDNGHDVFVFVPSDALTGSSSALTLPVVSVTNVSASDDPTNTNVFVVDGFVSTAVLVGLSVMTGNNNTLSDLLPDLIVTGINDGFTSGAQDLHSGTLAGALTGLSRGIPSLAVMTDAPEGTETDTIENELYFLQVASFTAGLIDRLDFTDFPRGMGLKIIYPNRNPDTVRGLVLAENNNDFFVTFDYRRSEENPETELVAEIRFLDEGEDGETNQDPAGETALVQDGFITALPIQSDIAVYASRYNENFFEVLSSIFLEITSFGQDVLVVGRNPEPDAQEEKHKKATDSSTGTVSFTMQQDDDDEVPDTSSSSASSSATGSVSFTLTEDPPRNR